MNRTLTRALAAIGFGLLSILCFALPAGAVTIGNGPHLEVSQRITLAPTWSQLIIGTLIPLAVAIVAHAKASSEIKSYLNLILSAIAAAVTALIAHGGSLPLTSFASAFFVVIAASQLSYVVAWKHRLAPYLAVLGNLGIGKPKDTSSHPANPTPAPPAG